MKFFSIAELVKPLLRFDSVLMVWYHFPKWLIFRKCNSRKEFNLYCHFEVYLLSNLTWSFVLCCWSVYWYFLENYIFNRKMSFPEMDHFGKWFYGTINPGNIFRINIFLGNLFPAIVINPERLKEAWKYFTVYFATLERRMWNVHWMCKFEKKPLCQTIY